MYRGLRHMFRLLIPSREQLQDQHALAAEIGHAITSVPIGEQPDEDELDAELEDLEQEAIDAKMVNTGKIPVGTPLDQLPAAGNTQRGWSLFHCVVSFTLTEQSSPPNGCPARRRRGSRIGKAAGRNGHVTAHSINSVLKFPFPCILSHA